MEFPKRESDVIRLGQKMVAGITTNKGMFPALPVTVDNLQKALTACSTAIDEVTAAEVSLERVKENKNTKYNDLVNFMKQDISYIKYIAGKNSSILEIIGWTVKKTKTILIPPGACCDLKVENLGDEGSFTASFEIKEDGGKPLAFIFQRLNETTGFWDDAVVSTEQKKLLTGQPQGKELQYRVTAFNKKGRGTPSNTIRVTLI